MFGVKTSHDKSNFYEVAGAGIRVICPEYAFRAQSAESLSPSCTAGGSRCGTLAVGGDIDQYRDLGWPKQFSRALGAALVLTRVGQGSRVIAATVTAADAGRLTIALVVPG